MIRFRVSSAARRDLLDAQDWYAQQSPGLDLKFLGELEKAFARIRAFPTSFPVVHQSIRRANLQRFPYGVFYVRQESEVLVLAVSHHARSPRYWQRR